MFHFLYVKKKTCKKSVISIKTKPLLLNSSDILDRIHAVYGECALSVGRAMFLLTIVAGEVLMEGLFAINFDWRIISSHV